MITISFRGFMHDQPGSEDSLEVYFLRASSSKAIAAEPSLSSPTQRREIFIHGGGRLKSKLGELGNVGLHSEGAISIRRLQGSSIGI